mmetsp:Transcript_29671/g.58776  ORF Transcript_29671/g.58776 Transcript_29671/m.58776 type:complete len:201 (+) Transcript_29671:4992-5594(+)
MRSNRGGHVYKIHNPGIFCAHTGGQYWHALTGVIRSGPAWVIAVIRCQDQQIIRPQILKDLSDFQVKPFQRPRIPGNVPAMAVETVKFYKICKGQATILGGFHQSLQILHQLGIRAFGAIINARHREDIANFANAMHLATGILHPIGQQWLRRRNRIISTVGGAGKLSLSIPHKWPRNHPANLHFVQSWRKILTQLQQAL